MSVLLVSCYARERGRPCLQAPKQVVTPAGCCAAWGWTLGLAPPSLISSGGSGSGTGGSSAVPWGAPSLDLVYCSGGGQEALPSPQLVWAAIFHFLAARNTNRDPLVPLTQSFRTSILPASLVPYATPPDHPRHSTTLAG